MNRSNGAYSLLKNLYCTLNEAHHFFKKMQILLKIESNNGSCDSASTVTSSFKKQDCTKPASLHDPTYTYYLNFYTSLPVSMLVTKWQKKLFVFKKNCAIKMMFQKFLNLLSLSNKKPAFFNWSKCRCSSSAEEQFSAQARSMGFKDTVKS